METFAKKVDSIQGLWNHLYALSVESLEVSKKDPKLGRKVQYDALKTLDNFRVRYVDYIQSNPYYQLGKIMKKIVAGENVSNEEISYGLELIKPLQMNSRRNVEEAAADLKKYF